MTAKKTDLERQVVSKLTASTAAWLIGMSDSGFRAAKPPKGDDGRTYDGRQLVKWHADRQQKADPLMDVATDSPALERYRTARAKLAELEYLQRCREVVPIREVQIAAARFNQPLRRAGEELGRRFGPEAQRLLNDAITQYIEQVKREFSALGSPDDHDDDQT